MQHVFAGELCKLNASYFGCGPPRGPRRFPSISNLFEWVRNKIQVNVNVSNNSIEWNSHCFLFYWKCRRQEEQQQQQQTAPQAAPVAAAADNLVLTHYPYPAAADQYISANTARPAVHWMIIPQQRR